MAQDIRAETRLRLTEAAKRWDGIVTIKKAAGGPELTDARFCLHAIRCAIDILRSRAHRRYVTDEWLREVQRRPASEIARLIEPLVPGGYPDPPAGRPQLPVRQYDDGSDLFP